MMRMSLPLPTSQLLCCLMKTRKVTISILPELSETEASNEVREEVEDFNDNRNLSGKRERKYGCWLTYSGLIQVCKELFSMIGFDLFHLLLEMEWQNSEKNCFLDGQSSRC